MASTNKTTNYELSQFLGTDKPAWLSDYNTDMSKIDAQMKLNADAATTAGGTATAANTAIGTLANLTTDVKTSVVAAINEVDSHADSAQGTASSALSTATGVSTDFNNFKTYMTLSSFTSYTTSDLQITAGSGTINNTNISVARNSAGTLAKIYGTINVSSTYNGASKIKLNVNTGLRPTSKITVRGLGFIDNAGGLTGLTVDINTDGTIEFYGVTDGSYAVRCFACLIFVEDFGDQAE